MKTNQLSLINKTFFCLHVLKGCLYFTNLAAAVIYILLRIVFSDYNIAVREDLFNLAETIAIASTLGAGLYIIYLTIITVNNIVRGKISLKIVLPALRIAIPQFIFRRKTIVTE
ncbi:MAG TPA: hypothetical protein PL045_08290 [Chitinophagaceae bacterium]|nr:hypothetical protein [Chitinophagaceae bacterium]